MTDVKWVGGERGRQGIRIRRLSTAPPGVGTGLEYTSAIAIMVARIWSAASSHGGAGLGEGYDASLRSLLACSGWRRLSQGTDYAREGAPLLGFAQG